MILTKINYTLVLDVNFGEDASRIRRGHGAENFTFLRRMAIGILNQENSKKRSLRQKSRLASMHSGYMLQVLTQAFFLSTFCSLFSCAYTDEDILILTLDK